MVSKDELLKGIRHASPEVKDAFLYTLLKIGGWDTIAKLESLMKGEISLEEFEEGTKPIQGTPRNVLEYIQHYLQDSSDALIAINIINRSRLFFGFNEEAPRTSRKDECFYSNGSFELRCTGEELRRQEYTFFLELLNTAKYQFEKTIRIHDDEFLSRCGFPTPTAENKDYLAESLQRMAKTEIKIVDSSTNTAKAVYPLVKMAEYARKSGYIYYELPRFLGELLLVPSDNPYSVQKRFDRNWAGSEFAQLLYDYLVNLESKKKELVKAIPVQWFADTLGFKPSRELLRSGTFHRVIENALIDLMHIKAISAICIPIDNPSAEDIFYIAFANAEVKTVPSAKTWKWLSLSSNGEVIRAEVSETPVVG